MRGYWIGHAVLVGVSAWTLWKATRPVPKDRPADKVTPVIGEDHLTRGPARNDGRDDA